MSELSQPELLALSLAQKYLDKMMLTEATMPFFDFYCYRRHFQNQDSEITGGSEILMDATTLTNLDIFSNNQQSLTGTDVSENPKNACSTTF